MKTREEFTSAEYASLRNEQNARINFMYTHGISTFTVVVAVFSINIGLFVGFYNLIENLILSSSMYYLAVVFMQGVLFFVPAVMILPASNKVGENLSQIATLGAYFRIFYELPLYDLNDGKVSWEILQTSLNDAHKVPDNKLKTFNFEYCILVLVSAALLCLFCIYYIWRMAVASHIASVIAFSCFTVAAIVLTVFISLRVFKNVSVKSRIAAKTADADKTMLLMSGNPELIEKAVALKIIDENTGNSLITELNKKVRDEGGGKENQAA